MYEKVLFRLNEYCVKNKIEYAVTGTCALDLLGVPSSFCPKDVDIVIYHPNDSIISKLKELEDFSGFEKAEYPDTVCYSFLVKGVKVNAIIDSLSSYDDIARDTVSLSVTDEKRAKHHLISVHSVWKAWASKMKLGRPKDISYALDIIHTLSTITGVKTYNV